MNFSTYIEIFEPIGDAGEGLQISRLPGEDSLKYDSLHKYTQRLMFCNVTVFLFFL